MWLLLVFIAVPLIEITLFIQVGGLIGLWPTLAIVIATALLGSRLVRSQGARELSNLRHSFNDLRDPTEPLANGAMIIFAGALLLTPGFFTDAVGFALLAPPVRAAVLRWVRSRMTVVEFSQRTSTHSTTDTVIDGEFSEIDPEYRASTQPSKWTIH
jgi:UPF0716 protein FxsA